MEKKGKKKNLAQFLKGMRQHKKNPLCASDYGITVKYQRTLRFISLTLEMYKSLQSVMFLQVRI